jgi:hypothetical protein
MVTRRATLNGFDGQRKGRELRRDVGLYSQVWCQSKSKKLLLGREWMKLTGLNLTKEWHFIDRKNSQRPPKTVFEGHVKRSRSREGGSILSIHTRPRTPTSVISGACTARRGQWYLGYVAGYVRTELLQDQGKKISASR